MTISITLKCDWPKCKNRIKTKFAQPSAAREKARAVGWGRYAGRDECPTHNTEMIGP